MKVQELLKVINDNAIYCLGEAEDYIDGEFMGSIEHNHFRWFSTCTDIYRCEDGFVGIHGLEHVFNEATTPMDCDYPCVAREYEKVPSITYKPKNDNN